MSVDRDGHGDPHEKPGIGTIEWQGHAKDNWFARADGAALGQSFDEAWDRAIPVDYPPARAPTEGYYHREGDVVILARPDKDDPSKTAIVSVIDLNDRSPIQQAYVRNQAARSRGWVE